MRIVAVCAALLACSHAKPVEESTPKPAAVTQAPPPAPAPVAQPVETPPAPQRAETIARPAPVETPAVAIYFAFDKSDLSAESRAALQQIADKSSGARIRIEGNCDERGTVEYNIGLGQRRADAAKKYLVNLGVPADQITAISFGEERPKATGHDPESWRENRRDDLFVIPGAVSMRTP